MTSAIKQYKQVERVNFGENSKKPGFFRGRSVDHYPLALKAKNIGTLEKVGQERLKMISDIYKPSTTLFEKRINKRNQLANRFHIRNSLSLTPSEVKQKLKKDSRYLYTGVPKEYLKGVDKEGLNKKPNISGTSTNLETKIYKDPMSFTGHYFGKGDSFGKEKAGKYTGYNHDGEIVRAILKKDQKKLLTNDPKDDRHASVRYEQYPEMYHKNFKPHVSGSKPYIDRIENERKKLVKHIEKQWTPSIESIRKGGNFKYRGCSYPIARNQLMIPNKNNSFAEIRKIFEKEGMAKDVKNSTLKKVLESSFESDTDYQGDAEGLVAYEKINKIPNKNIIEKLITDNIMESKKPFENSKVENFNFAEELENY